MGKYERIAFDLLEAAFGDRWVRDDSRIFSFGPDAGAGEVDGTIDGRIAVEIGVGSLKQIRASVFDLALPIPTGGASRELGRIENAVPAWSESVE